MDLLDEMLSFIFPKTCGFCGKIGKSYFCKNCESKIQSQNFYLNKIDDYSNDNTKFFNLHYYMFSYTSIIREKIIDYKFNDETYLARTFCEIFAKNRKLSRFLKFGYDIIIPVPMTKKKIAKRGYNQSELIAKLFCKMLAQQAKKQQKTAKLKQKNNYVKIKKQEPIILVKNALKKVKNNETQSTLNKHQRYDNVKDAYKVTNKQIIKEKRVLLFDDIYTTGATCNECAKVLLEAGAKKVDVLTLAKDLLK